MKEYRRADQLPAIVVQERNANVGLHMKICQIQGSDRCGNRNSPPPCFAPFIVLILETDMKIVITRVERGGLDGL